MAPDGAVTRYKPPVLPHTPITRSERHAQYRRGLQIMDQLLKSAGFYCNAIEQSSVSLSVQKGKMMFDISLRDPRRVAYVTSGKFYDPENPKPTIVKANELIQADCMIQVIGSKSGGSSTNPVYIPLPATIIDPARYVVFNVVKAMQSMIADSEELRDIELSLQDPESQLRLDLESSDGLG